MKKVSKLLVALVMLIIAATALIACPTTTDEVSEIKITETPRVVFVQGQGLDLFGGELTVVKDSGEETIPLDSPDIAVTGFDTNTVGQQQITITYGGKSTTLTVKVVKRIAVDIESKDLKYFVGEEFDRTHGTITLTQDDGATVSKNLNDSSVVISGLDTFADNAGKNVLTVSYGGYTDTFEVNVLEPADVSFRAPSKITYDSHETEMDLAGGVITYKDSIAVNDSGSGTTKTVYLTKDMVSGFNPAAATYEENYEGIGGSDLVQEIQVNYGGRTHKFNVYIDFSDISLIKHYAGVLANEIDWDNTEAQFTEEQLKMGEEAATLYFALGGDNATDKANLQRLISYEEKCAIMPIAAHYAYMSWLAGIVEYDDAIALSVSTTDYTADVSFIADSYEDAKVNLARLQETGFKNLADYNNLLWNILSDQELSNISIIDDVTILSYCTYAVNQQNIDFEVGALEEAIRLYDLMKGVTLSDVTAGQVSSDTRTKVEECYQAIIDSYYLGWRTVFATVNAWNNEYFDILYQYYYDVAMRDSSNKEWNTNEGLNALFWMGYGAYMPEPLEIFYTYTNYALTTIQSDSEYINSYGIALDSSQFFFYYNESLKAAEAVANSENELYRNLFNVMQFAYNYFYETIVDEETNQEMQNLTPVFSDSVLMELDYRNLYYKSSMYKVDEFGELLDEYLVLVESYMSGKYFETVYPEDETQRPYQVYTEAFYSEVPVFFEKFTTYSTTIQANFLENLSFIRGTFDINSEEYYNIFSLLFAAYYSVESEVLDEATFEVFSNLTTAYESILRRGADDGNEETFDYTLYDFLDYFDLAEEGYEDLAVNQKENISFLYDYLAEVREMYNNNGELVDIDLSNYPEWEARFNNVATILGKVFFIFEIEAYYGIKTGATLFSYAAVANNEYAKLLDEINAVQDEDLKALLFKALQFKEISIYPEIYDGDLNLSLSDCYFNYVRLLYCQMIFETAIFSQTELFFSRLDEDMEDVFAATADIEYAMLRVLLQIGNSSEIIGQEEFDTIFKEFLSFDSEWTIEQKVVFAELNLLSELGDLFLQAFWGYYSVETGIAQSNDVANSPDAIFAFMDLAYNYMYYDYILSLDGVNASEYASAYQNSLNSFNSAYNSLSDAQKTAFNTEFGEDLINAYKTAPTRN